MSDLPREVILAARGGDPEAFATIVRRYQHRIHALAYRLTYDTELAKDATQEVFLRLHERFDRYDPARPFPPWFLRLATNLTLNLREKARRRRTFSLDAPIGEDGETSSDPPERDRVSVEESAVQAEERAAIRAEVQKLPEKYAGVVVLHYLEGLSVREIAERLDMAEGTVKIRLYRARDRLRSSLRGIAGEDEA